MARRGPRSNRMVLGQAALGEGGDGQAAPRTRHEWRARKRGRGGWGLQDSTETVVEESGKKTADRAARHQADS